MTVTTLGLTDPCESSRDTNRREYDDRELADYIVEYFRKYAANDPDVLFNLSIVASSDVSTVKKRAKTR